MLTPNSPATTIHCGTQSPTCAHSTVPSVRRTRGRRISMGIPSVHRQRSPLAYAQRASLFLT